MQKIIDELIKHSIKGVDVYRWKNATWLIFTDETRWVVELTDEGTLWYNYKFFKDVFKYVSITVGEEMDEYIIRWANDYFFKDSAHRSIAYNPDKDRSETEKVLYYGIKDISKSSRTLGDDYVEKIVGGGIKEIGQHGKNHGDEFEWHTRAVISKGIKEVYDSSATHRQMRAENLIPRIVKDIKPNRVTIKGEKMDRFYYSTDCAGNNTEIFRIVEEGVKKVKPNIEYSKQSGVYHPDCVANHIKIEKVVEEGVKRVYPDQNSGEYDWSDEFEAGKVIEKGIKVIPLPTIKDLRGYSDYYSTKEDRTKPHTEYVIETIENGKKIE